MRARSGGRVVLLGATGIIGRLAAAALVRQGIQPVLAGSDEVALVDLAEQLRPDLPGGDPVSYDLVDSSDPAAVRGLVKSSSDVLITTISPSVSPGEIAVEAAIDAGCGYLDCAWEPAFARSVFQRFGPVAARHGAVLIPAFGCHYVAGALAAMIAVRRATAGPRPPARVDVGHFLTAQPAPPRHVLTGESFRWSQDRLRTERPGQRVRVFDVGGKRLEALSLGTAESFTVPKLAASITEVNTYVGWFGRMTRPAAMAGAVGGTKLAVPGVSGVLDGLIRGIGREGPTPAVAHVGDTNGRSIAVAETFGADGSFQERVRVVGPAPAALSAALLSWGAGMLLQSVEAGSGVRGPVDAFGDQALIGGCTALGLAEAHG